MTELTCDPERMVGVTLEDGDPTVVSGVLVRAKWQERWINADIVYLDDESLRAWLHSRGECNRWAEGVVALLLGHVGWKHP